METNTQHLKNNYKSSTLPRLMEQLGYKNEMEIDQDNQITSLLSFLKEQNLQTQDAFFMCLNVMKNY